jgi:hypothetical protein
MTRALICLIGLLHLPACITADDPDVAELQQDEIIEVHGCRPGFWELGDGTCVDPWPWHPGGGGGGGPIGGERRPAGPGGGGGGGGGGAGGPGANITDPSIYIQYTTVGGVVCRAVCWAAGSAVCAAVATSCAIGSTVTIGGLIVPCTAAIIAACATSGGASSICSDLICPS